MAPAASRKAEEDAAPLEKLIHPFVFAEETSNEGFAVSGDEAATVKAWAFPFSVNGGAKKEVISMVDESKSHRSVKEFGDPSITAGASSCRETIASKQFELKGANEEWRALIALSSFAHEALIRQSGKDENMFIVRIYWRGRIHEILVDDQLPLTGREKLKLIHFTDGVNVHLWPALLQKAQLWLEARTKMRVHPLTLFYGWERLSNQFRRVSSSVPVDLNWTAIKEPKREDYFFATWEHFQHALKLAENGKNKSDVTALLEAEAQVNAKKEEILHEEAEKQGSLSKKKKKKKTKRMKEAEELTPFNSIGFNEAVVAFENSKREIQEKLVKDRHYMDILQAGEDCVIYVVSLNKSAGVNENDLERLANDENWSLQPIQISRGSLFLIVESTDTQFRLIGGEGKDGSNFWIEKLRVFEANMALLRWAVIDPEYNHLVLRHQIDDENGNEFACFKNMALTFEGDQSSSFLFKFIAKDEISCNCAIGDGTVVLSSGDCVETILSLEGFQSINIDCKGPAVIEVIALSRNVKKIECKPALEQQMQFSFRTAGKVRALHPGRFAIMHRHRLVPDTKEDWKLSASIICKSTMLATALYSRLKILVVEHETGRTSRVDDEGMRMAPQQFSGSVDILFVTESVLASGDYTILIGSDVEFVPAETRALDSCKFVSRFQKSYIPNRNSFLLRHYLDAVPVSMSLEIRNISQNPTDFQLRLLAQDVESQLKTLTLGAKEGENELLTMESQHGCCRLHWIPQICAKFHRKNPQKRLIFEIRLASLEHERQPFWCLAQLEKYEMDQPTEVELPRFEITSFTDVDINFFPETAWETALIHRHQSFSPEKLQRGANMRHKFQSDMYALVLHSHERFLPEELELRKKAIDKLRSLGWKQPGVPFSLAIPRCPAPTCEEEAELLDKFQNTGAFHEGAFSSC